MFFPEHPFYRDAENRVWLVGEWSVPTEIMDALDEIEEARHNARCDLCHAHVGFDGDPRSARSWTTLVL